MGDTGIFRVLRRGNDVKAFGKLGQFIAVRHPHLHIILEAIKEAIDVTIDSLRLEIGMTILARRASNHVVLARPVCYFLQAVAYTQDRHAQVEIGRVYVRRTLFVHRVRASGQDDTGGLPGKISQLLGAGKHLRVDIELSETASDQMRILRAV